MNIFIERRRKINKQKSFWTLREHTQNEGDVYFEQSFEKYLKEVIKRWYTSVEDSTVKMLQSKWGKDPKESLFNKFL